MFWACMTKTVKSYDKNLGSIKTKGNFNKRIETKLWHFTLNVSKIFSFWVIRLVLLFTGRSKLDITSFSCYNCLNHSFGR